MEKVQIIPPPKDVDPAVLAWKGASVLGKMDGVADLWVTVTDWASKLCLDGFNQLTQLLEHFWYAWSQGTMLLLVNRHVMICNFVKVRGLTFHIISGDMQSERIMIKKKYTCV
jgi:hypothetical protein